MTAIYAALAFLSGSLFPLQTAINAQLGRLAGGALVATIISFVVGLTALTAMLLVTTRSFPDIALLRSIPPHLFIGGLLGASFLGCSVFLVPLIGSGTMMCLVVAGQVLTSMGIDQFGLFGLPIREPSLPRLIGGVLVMIGVFLVRFA
jgi:transporter family-2 protein